MTNSNNPNSLQDAQAQYDLGLLHYDNQNYQGAANMFTQAADQNHVSAQFMLGVMHDQGEWFSQNYTLAIDWYTHAANQEHILSQYNRD